MFDLARNPSVTEMRTTTQPCALLRLCDDLRLIRQEAEGPSERILAARAGLNRSQVTAILRGRIDRPPDWKVLRDIVTAIYEYAYDHHRLPRLSIRAGLDDYWKPRHAEALSGLRHSPTPSSSAPTPNRVQVRHW